MTALLAATVPAQAREVLQLDLPALDGSHFIRLDDVRGRPALINFWASDCPGCIAEWPLLQAVPDGEIWRLGVAVDQRIAALERVHQLGSMFPQTYAAQNAASLLRRFGNPYGALPYTVVLDARHRLCARHIGAVDATWIRQALAQCASSLLDVAATIKPTH